MLNHTSVELTSLIHIYYAFYFQEYPCSRIALISKYWYNLVPTLAILNQPQVLSPSILPPFDREAGKTKRPWKPLDPCTFDLEPNRDEIKTSRCVIGRLLRLMSIRLTSESGALGGRGPLPLMKYEWTLGELILRRPLAHQCSDYWFLTRSKTFGRLMRSR